MVSKGDWLVLCALVIEHEHGFRHAMHFMMRFFREAQGNEVRIITDPSVVWWTGTNARKMTQFLLETGMIKPEGIR